MNSKAFQKLIRCKMIDHDMKSLEEVRAFTTLSKPTFLRCYHNPDDFRVRDIENIFDGLEITKEERVNL